MKLVCVGSLRDGVLDTGEETVMELHPPQIEGNEKWVRHRSICWRKKQQNEKEKKIPRKGGETQKTISQSSLSVCGLRHSQLFPQVIFCFYIYCYGQGP